ncbi:MAG TPA: hypothetical protein VIC71_06615, partial [Gammaproteobacteria bacterium]
MNNLKHWSKRRLALAIGVVCMPPAAYAQHDIDEMIVTGTIRDRAVGEIAQSVTVVAADTLDRVRAVN